MWLNIHKCVYGYLDRCVKILKYSKAVSQNLWNIITIVDTMCTNFKVSFDWLHNVKVHFKVCRKLNVSNLPWLGFNIR